MSWLFDLTLDQPTTSWKSEVQAPQGYRTMDSCWLGHETHAGWDMDGTVNSCWLGRGRVMRLVLAGT